MILASGNATGKSAESNLVEEFLSVNFGKADASEEAFDPRLLLEGFLDWEKISDRVVYGSEFLFLGYKGSGKTALQERAKLLAQDLPGLFVQTTSLGVFPFKDFKAAAGGREPLARYPTVWKWLVLVSIFQSLAQDEAGVSLADPSYRKATAALRALRVIPTPGLKALVTSTSKKSFKAEIPKVFSFTNAPGDSQDLQLSQAVEALELVASHFPSSSHHVLIIDGLDDIFNESELQFQSLAALITAAQELNQTFRLAGKKFKIVVLCRTDIFDKLPGANTNKVLLDSGFALNWYESPDNPRSTRLVRLIDRRASLALDRNVDVIGEFFPARVRGRPTTQFFLDHTRHTPRDIIQLMIQIQEAAARNNRLGEQEAREGLGSYSTKYFRREIRNELHGYLQTPEIEELFSSFQGLPSQDFRLEALEDQSREMGLSVDLETGLKAMFECSAVGKLTFSRRGNPHFTFKYRNPDATLSPSRDKMWVHPGACKALDVRFGMKSRPPRAKRPKQ